VTIRKDVYRLIIAAHDDSGGDHVAFSHSFQAQGTQGILNASQSNGGIRSGGNLV
jgi:hypothetical protein